MPKYILIQISGIYTQIAKLPEIKGYTEGVIECFLPEDGLSKKERQEWIRESNNRMHKICKFLNDNNL